MSNHNSNSGNSKKKGSYGENIAAGYLEARGYEILVKNYKRGSGEIDIIAKSNGAIVFVEVKYRQTLSSGLPREAVTKVKQNRLKNAAMHYITENQLSDIDMRFDVVEIFENELLSIEHIVNAFY